MQPLQLSSTPIQLKVASQTVYTAEAGKVAKVTMVVSNTDAGAHVLSFDIDGSGKPMKVSIAAGELVELPAILVCDGGALGVLADADDVLYLLGRVEIV